ncbi:hypothetical protein AVEN_64461-1 [Araneus ventricosus]|uniref:Uncharacterized protein n=1 Tax=Araneus ventricosus TaxID=182803 RepID=A0A4Y2P1P0_ARAVE|nr:hypothetical protein AVEN_64461-1 [Araneus ventricosus]
MTRTTPELTPLSKLPRHTNGRTIGHYVWLSMQQAPYTADLRWNRDSSLEPTCPKAGTLPLRPLNIATSPDSNLASTWKKLYHTSFFFVRDSVIHASSSREKFWI